MKKIRIMQVLSPLTIAGAERVLLMLVKNIDRSLFDVSLCLFINAQKPRNPFVDEVEKLDINTEMIYLDKIFRWRYVKELFELLQKKQIDIIHTHSHRADVTGYFANRYWNAKLISTIHGWTPSTNRLKLYECIDRWVLKKFDQIITVSNDIKNNLIKYKIPNEKITTVHNAIDLSCYPDDISRNSFKNELHIMSNEKLIGTIGRLSKEKGLDNFLLVAKKILDHRNNIKFVIVGDGPEKQKLLKLRDKLGLNKEVYFYNYTKDVSWIYQALDIFVLTSTTEGIPISLLESSYFSKPFIAYKVGGIPEIFEGVGLLVKPGDIDMMVEKILYYLDYEFEAQRYSEMMREYVVKKYNASNWIKAMEAIYLTLRTNQNFS